MGWRAIRQGWRESCGCIPREGARLNRPLRLGPARHGRRTGGQEAMPPSGPDQQARWHPWQPDGWGWRGRLGLLLPHADIEPDTEFATLAPEGVSTHAVRVRWPRVAGQEALTRARLRGPPAPGRRRRNAGGAPPPGDRPLFYEQQLCARTRRRCGAQGPPGRAHPGEPCGDHLGGGRGRLADGRRAARGPVHPPWFTDDIDQRGAAYFQHQGFEVVSHARAPLRPDRGQIHPRPPLRMGAGAGPP